MTSFEKCSSALDSLNSVNLRFRPKTNEAVENARVIATSFEQTSETERDRLLVVINSALAMKLLGLSGFVAEAAVNADDESLIRTAIILHVVEDFRKDYRENYRYLVLIAHASKRIGVDLKFVIASVDHIASGRAKKCLSDFVSRNDDLNRLESFGIKAEVVDGGFRFAPM